MQEPIKEKKQIKKKIIVICIISFILLLLAGGITCFIIYNNRDNNDKKNAKASIKSTKDIKTIYFIKNSDGSFTYDKTNQEPTEYSYQAENARIDSVQIYKNYAIIKGSICIVYDIENQKVELENIHSSVDIYFEFGYGKVVYTNAGNINLYDIDSKTNQKIKGNSLSVEQICKRNEDGETKCENEGFLVYNSTSNYDFCYKDKSNCNEIGYYSLSKGKWIVPLSENTYATINEYIDPKINLYETLEIDYNEYYPFIISYYKNSSDTLENVNVYDLKGNKLNLSNIPFFDNTYTIIEHQINGTRNYLIFDNNGKLVTNTEYATEVKESSIKQNDNDKYIAYNINDSDYRIINAKTGEVVREMGTYSLINVTPYGFLSVEYEGDDFYVQFYAYNGDKIYAFKENEGFDGADSFKQSYISSYDQDSDKVTIYKVFNNNNTHKYVDVTVDIKNKTILYGEEYE